MQFESQYRNESFNTPMLLEYIMTGLFTLFTIAIIGLYIIGRGTARAKSENLPDISVNQVILICGIIGLICAVITCFALHSFRNIWYITAIKFDDTKRMVTIARRKLKVESQETVSISYDQLRALPTVTRGILFINKYNGILLSENTHQLGVILHDHFSWEEQGRDYRDINDKLVDIVQ